ncbi:MAG: hypothetical protein KDK97_12590 [Verrucomicrobiales bacterium]|nr:hypothetical protein [Verrucomicrobiales bacterium]
MKQSFQFPSALRVLALSSVLASPVGAWAQAEADGDERTVVDYALILPAEKAPESVQVDARNPFQAAEDTAQKEVTNTEQNTVRDMLLALPVVGVSPGPNGIRVLLGDIRLEEGMEVPPMVPNQTVRLRVNSITQEGIELLWVERKQTGLPPVPLHIPIDIGPRVAHMLPGRFAGDPKNPGDRSTSMGVWQPPQTVVTTSKARRAAVVKEDAPNVQSTAQGPGAPTSAPESSSAKTDPASALLQMFFGSGGSAPATR